MEKVRQHCLCHAQGEAGFLVGRTKGGNHRKTQQELPEALVWMEEERCSCGGPQRHDLLGDCSLDGPPHVRVPPKLVGRPLPQKYHR